jgi:hypothetical protein
MSSTTTHRNSNAATAGGGNAVYGLGMIGALVHYLQAADAWWEYLLAFIQAVLWPAFLVYEAFGGLAGS